MCSSIFLDFLLETLGAEGFRSSYLGVCDEQTVGVLVFTGDLILRQHVGQLLDKSDHFLVPGDISHGQAAGGALPAVRHSLRTARHTPSKLKFRRGKGGL